MGYNLITIIESCEVVVPNLLYYSHIPTTIIILLFSIFVFLKSKHDRQSGTILLLISIVFTFWTGFNIVLWTTLNGSLMMFLWSTFSVLYAQMFILCLYLSYFLLYKKTYTQGLSKYAIFITFLPLLILLPTDIHLDYFDIANCEPSEGILVAYQYAYGFFVALWTTLLFIIHFNKPKGESRSKIAISAFAILLFLFAFSWSEIIGSITLKWEYTQYGLFGMPLLVGLLSYLIVQYKIFNVKLLGAQALVITLWALVGSLLFVAKSDTTRIVAGATLVFTTFAGYLLVRSVKKEVHQREELELLTHALEKANERLKELDKAKSEFVSIASHQLRSPLTAIRGYASMLAEGSFGQMPAKAQESARRIEESAKLMAMSIEDYLNVSRIESGNMKYNLSDFNLHDLASTICDDLRSDALKRNLILLFRSDLKGKGIVNADVGKTHQIIHNLVNNSIKYTPKGSVSVFARDDVKTKHIYIDITDTGIGMSQETIGKLFGKFSRADNANSVNTSGTGLGLFVAVKMAEAMGGTITAKSEGDGKGSTFTFELPMVM